MGEKDGGMSCPKVARSIPEALTERLEPEDARAINRVVAVVNSVSFKVNGLLWDVSFPPFEQLAQDLDKALRHLNNALARLEPHSESLDAIQREFETVNQVLWAEPKEGDSDG